MRCHGCGKCNPGFAEEFSKPLRVFCGNPCFINTGTKRSRDENEHVSRSIVHLREAWSDETKLIAGVYEDGDGCAVLLFPGPDYKRDEALEDYMNDSSTDHTQVNLEFKDEIPYPKNLGRIAFSTYSPKVKDLLCDDEEEDFDINPATLEMGDVRMGEFYMHMKTPFFKGLGFSILLWALSNIDRLKRVNEITIEADHSDNDEALMRYYQRIGFKLVALQTDCNIVMVARRETLFERGKALARFFYKET